ncbi:MAG: M24 family metallopeptidase [Limisphaerales bacterium]
MSPDNLLIVADTEHNADMLYAVRMFLPDPFIYFRTRQGDHIVLSDLELDRGRRKAGHCRVLSLSQCQRKLNGSGGAHGSASLAEVIRQLARERRLKRFLVPANFPHGLARDLRRLKVRVKVKPGALFFADREFKNAEEIKKISAALLMAEVGMAEGLQALRFARIGPHGKLLQRGVPLTSERLRAVIETAIIQAGGTASHTIVAGGRQACDPHEIGHGPLKANQPIVIDIFPRSQKTGYYGDITRTFVKGKASEAVHRQYQTVRQAQEEAISRLRHGVEARSIHADIQKHFEAAGYRTSRRQDRLEGFFHGTGHGLGLEIHEPPRINATSRNRLRSGHIVTIEPGLYYRATGGVRLEDVVLITPSGARNLTQFEKVLEV